MKYRTLGAITALLFPFLPTQDYKLTATPNSDGTVRITWDVPAGRPGNDWIGITPKGSAPGAYMDGYWLYTNGTRAAGVSTPTTGNVLLPMPTDPGIYEARYYLDGGFTAGGVVEFEKGGTPPPPNTPPTEPGAEPGSRTVRLVRIVVTRASGSTDTYGPFASSVVSNFGQSTLSTYQAQLQDGESVRVDEWNETVVIPERVPDVIWSARVNRRLE